jgi:4-amino-4-deoxy-L-arabinose transferase-like glycosyltransferase
MSVRTLLITLVCLFSALIFVEIPGSKLFEPDEARYAEIPREMLATHDFITPHQNGSIYLEKPPLYYWLTALSMKIFGENPFAARLPARLAALGVVFLLIYGLRNMVVPLLGWWAALIFLANPLALAMSRLHITDGLLTFSLTLTLFCLRSFIFNPSPSWRAQAGLGLGMAMAVLTKGLIGIVFPAGLVILWSILFLRWDVIKKLIFSWALPLFLVLSVPWFILVQKANPTFFQFFIIEQHFKRFATNEARREGPIYYFVLTLLWGLLPWTFHFIPAFKDFFKKLRHRIPTEEVFFGLWFFIILIFFSLSHSKLIPYIFPVWPAVAMMLASAWERKIGLSRKVYLVHAIFLSVIMPIACLYGFKEGVLPRYSLIEEALSISLILIAGGWMAYAFYPQSMMNALATLAMSWLLVFIILIVSVPILSDDYSSEGLAQTARKSGAQTIASYRCYPESLPWILKHPIPVVDHQGELASVGPLDPSLFWKPVDFNTHWNSSEKMAVVMRRGEMDSFISSSHVPCTVLDQNHRYVLLANFPAN